MKLNPLIPLLVLLSLGCTRNTPKDHFHSLGTLEFNLGHAVNHRYIGLFEYQHNDLLFYFGDPVSVKNIKIFNADGILQHIVPLRVALDTLIVIEDIEIVSMDTILLFGERNNKIGIVDRMGKVRKVLDYSEIKPPFNNVNFVYRTSVKGNFVDSTHLFLHAEYQGSKSDSVTLSLVEYFRQALTQPYFLKVVHYADDHRATFSFHLDNFYTRLMTESRAMGELPRYSVSNTHGIVLSLFSDTVYVLNRESLVMIKKFKAVSDFTALGSKPVVLTSREKYAEYFDYIKYNGYISHVFEDTINLCYAVVVIWENKNRRPEHRNSSIIFYDFDGKRLFEWVLPEDLYAQGLSYFHNGIYYVSANSPKNEFYDQNKIIFEKFTLDLL